MMSAESYVEKLGKYQLGHKQFEKAVLRIFIESNINGGELKFAWKVLLNPDQKLKYTENLFTTLISSYLHKYKNKLHRQYKLPNKLKKDIGKYIEFSVNDCSAIESIVDRVLDISYCPPSTALDVFDWFYTEQLLAFTEQITLHPFLHSHMMIGNKDIVKFTKTIHRMYLIHLHQQNACSSLMRFMSGICEMVNKEMNLDIKTEKLSDCCVCYEEKQIPIISLFECSHDEICFDCIPKLKNNCPICRSERIVLEVPKNAKL
jgi:hypothetical protein